MDVGCGVALCLSMSSTNLNIIVDSMIGAQDMEYMWLMKSMLVIRDILWVNLYDWYIRG